MMTATELATVALHDFLLRVGNRTSSLLVHGSHGGTIPEHARAFVKIVGDTLGRASLDEVIQLRDWMVDGALAALTAPQPQDWSDEYYMDVSHSIVGICKASATIPSTAGSTSWRMAMCSHTPDVVSITVPPRPPEERALEEQLDIARVYTGSRSFKHAYCARGAIAAVPPNAWKDLPHKFFPPPVVKFMVSADPLLGKDVKPVNYGAMSYIHPATQYDLLVSGTFSSPAAAGVSFWETPSRRRCPTRQTLRSE